MDLVDILPHDLAFLTEVVRRNSGLHATALPRDQRLDEPAVRLRWRRWLRFGAGNDWRLLRRRMRAEGLRPAVLYQPREVAILPAWAGTLQAIRQEARQLGRNPQALRGLLPEGAMALPFSDLLAPCLVVARRRLSTLQTTDAARGTADCLGEQALATLELALLRRLGQIVGPSLLTLFGSRGGVPPALGILLAQAGAPPRAQYDAFVVEQLSSGLQGLGEGWPVALRLLAELLDQWAESTAEFASRLCADADAIRDVIFPGEPALGRVVTLGNELSDPHAEGRTVFKIEFEDGRRLVYKPRPMEMEAIFSDTLAWLNAAWQMPHPRQRVARVLTRLDYGWMEWIESEAMTDPEDAAVYHWRLGGLTAVLRALRGMDMHRENIVAAGAFPVFVDVECLLHPSAVPFLEMPAPPQSDLNSGLLYCGLLPFYESTEGPGGMTNLGAIASTAQDRGPPAVIYRHVNSDWMCLGRQAIVRSIHHQPQTENGWVNAFDHAGRIAAGYRETLAYLLIHREWLLANSRSPWRALGQARGRHLARNTWNYGLLMNGALDPEAMTDGICFDLTFEPLHRHLHLLTPGYRSMAVAERRDLHRLDVPRFGFAAASRLLFDAHGQPLGEMHAQTPYDAMATQLRGLRVEDVTREAELLQQVLTEYRPQVHTTLGAAAAELCSRRLGTSESVWLSLGMRGGGVSVGPMAPGLYSGTTGVAFALAAAGRVLQCEKSAGLAQALLGESLHLLVSEPSRDTLLPIGYDQGLAGLLYTYHACADLCDGTALRDEAGRRVGNWVANFDPARALRPGQTLDLLNGAAGLLSVLLRWHQVYPDEGRWLDAARRCGDHLLRQARPEARGISWGATGAVGLSGLSHGGSGFALALAALYRASGETSYRRTAFAAVEYEATLFAPGLGNWRDLRGFRGDDVQQVVRCGCSWCHGAPGIALVRAALLNLLADDLSDIEQLTLERELELALTTTRAMLAHRPQTMVDDLCCGSAGSIDILLECGRLLDRPELMKAAHDEANARAAALQTSRYWFTGQGMAGADLSLFKGLASQVYLQARLIAPDIVPCVLLPVAVRTGVRLDHRTQGG
jgi:type 2 lantibiotic biosynthesis protein LanM